MAKITDLPLELLIHIFQYLARRRDISALSRCTRNMHWLVSQELFGAAFVERSQLLPPEVVFMLVFFEAVNHDSIHLIQWLILHGLRSNLTRFVPLCKKDKITYLHFAIINDAPKVATSLVLNGADVYEGERDYPDLTPLYLAITRPQDYADNLDGPLRIASSFALPRMCEYLLVRGAHPNQLSNFGLSAMHLATMRRLPWHNFNRITTTDCRGKRIHKCWDDSILQTVSALLRFGGDSNLKSATSRVHHCGHKCWRSLDCDHRGQTVLHFASASGQQQVVYLLLQHGANPEAFDDDGYSPLYVAIAQGHCSLALCLLSWSSNPSNFIIVRKSRSTVLHIACRFASLKVALYVLKKGAYVNTTDSLGQTPLHELLGQTHPELERSVIRTLKCLERYGASFDFEAFNGSVARRMMRTHSFKCVREYFEPVGHDTLRSIPPFL